MGGRGLVVFGRRVVIPLEERRGVVVKLHAAHLGEERTLRRARQAVFWPGLTSDVRNHVRACVPCQQLRPSQGPQELARDPAPTFAFQELAADYGEVAGRHSLIVADRWSGYPAVYPVMGHPNSAKTVAALRLHFAMFGAPLRLFSDGGLVFTSDEFQRFLLDWGIRHRVSSAEYPQSNGLAEVTVKTVKHLLLKTGGFASSPEFLEGLLGYRLTPRGGGRSPSEMIFGQSVRSRVPMLTAARLDPAVTAADHVARTEAVAAKAKARVDARARDLPELAKGDRVWVQSERDKRWRKTGKILRRGNHRDYWVQMDQGGRVLRTRRALRLVRGPLSDEREELEEPEGEEEPGPRRSARAVSRPRSYRE